MLWVNLFSTVLVQLGLVVVLVVVIVLLVVNQIVIMRVILHGVKDIVV